MPAVAAEKVTIVAFGDSLTQGYGLAEADGFVPQLQEWLAANGAPDVVLVNAGVSGDTTAGGLARIDWTLGDDVDGVIVALGGNDLLRGLFPEDSRANLDGILAAVTGRGLPVMLVGLPAPKNYGPEFEAGFAAMYPELAQKYGAVFYANFLAGISEEGLPDLALMQADATHPSAEGVARIVADMGPKVLELVARARQ